MVVDGKLRFGRECSQLFFVFEFPLHHRAVFGGEPRANKGEENFFVKLIQKLTLIQKRISLEIRFLSWNLEFLIPSYPSHDNFYGQIVRF